MLTKRFVLSIIGLIVLLFSSIQPVFAQEEVYLPAVRVSQEQSVEAAGGTNGEKIHVRPPTLEDHECNDSEWHFVINQLADPDKAPAKIRVKFSDGSEVDVPLEKVSGGVAHYTYTGKLNLTVVDAWTWITTEHGQFNLSHGPCGEPTETPTPTPEPQFCTEGEILFDQSGVTFDDGDEFDSPIGKFKVEFLDGDSQLWTYTREGNVMARIVKQVKLTSLDGEIEWLEFVVFDFDHAPGISFDFEGTVVAPTELKEDEWQVGTVGLTATSVVVDYGKDSSHFNLCGKKVPVTETPTPPTETPTPPTETPTPPTETPTPPTETPTPPTETPTPPTETPQPVGCVSESVSYDFIGDTMTGSTTGRGASWILYQVPDEGQLVQIAQGSAENTQFQDTPIHFGGYIVKWFDDQGAEGSEVCEFKPHRLFAPFIADQVPPVCLNMTADVPTDHPIYAGRQVTFTVSVQDTATVFFEGQEQVPVDGIATFTLSVDPGVTYFPSLQAMHGPIVEAPNCAIRYEPFSEEIERFTIIYADPEYIVREYTGQAEIDWVNGQFGTTIGRTRDGSYNLDLSGPEGPNGEKIAYAAGLLGPSEMVFGFKKIKSSFVYHHEVGWTEDGVSALITELGTNVWESGNPNPIQFATEPGETGTPWSAELVGQGRYLPNGTYYVAGRFNDYRNTNTPVWAVRNECIGLVALRENVPSSAIPHSGKFLLLQYAGCDDNAWNGYLSPLLRGDDDVRNPNDYRRDSLVPGINAASAEEETHIEFQPATVDLEWDR